MDIIYLITNTKKEKAGQLPNKYIGSKTNWKGPNTYWGSSCNPIMKKELAENIENFRFELLEEINDVCSINEKEAIHQLKVKAAPNPEYYNLKYACDEWSNAGYKWMTNGSNDVQVPSAKTEQLLNEGYEYGRSAKALKKPWNAGIKATKERSNNMSKALKGKVPWNVGKKGVQLCSDDKPMMKPYKAIDDLGNEHEVRTVGQNKQVCLNSGNQYQNISYHLNQRSKGKDPISKSGWKFFRL